MKICIYCKQTEKETDFPTKEGEHIISQFLGRFDLYFGDDDVCQECNNEFSKAETIFKEGSLAGIHSAVYGIDDTKSSIRVRKDRVSWTISSDTGELGVFKDVFPFVKLIASHAYPKSIIILDHKDSKIKYILFIEKYALYAEKQDTKNFQKRKKVIEKLKQKFGKLDIMLFGDPKKGWTIEKVIALLKDYDLSYNKKSEESVEDTNRGTEWTVNYTENGNAESLKTPAKIAFNYFAFCAKKANMINILQNSNFDYMRKYIRYGELPPIIYKPMFRYNSNQKDNRGFHVVTFQKENNFITSFISLFGRFDYKVVLGKYPFRIQINNFGCKTTFDPFSKKIITTPRLILGRKDYGLSCR